MSKLALFVGAQWHALGEALDLKHYELSAVEHDRQTARERSAEVLLRWRQRVGRRVRVSKLLKLLRHDTRLLPALEEFVSYLRSLEK